MQTFLPYENFVKTAKCLDYKRLGKQRIEAKQIYLALTKKKYGWKNHPAVKMWRGSEFFLVLYGIEICMEWRKRGYQDNQLKWFLSKLKTDKLGFEIPIWLGSRKFHQSHKSNLVRKNAAHYKKYFPNIKNNIPYYWPVN